MTKIENELDFKVYMEKYGPSGKASRSNYISWLNFISDNGFEINTNLKGNEQILSFLRSIEKNRDKYKSKDAYSDFGSALNKYRNFIHADFCMITDDYANIDSENVSETEKEELRKARVGQGKFRKELINIWKKCSVTQIERKELLIASHILPWRVSTNEQRLDKFNGLLLIPNYDKLFDRGLISFNDDGRIIISPQLDSEEYLSLGISSQDKLTIMFDENKYYLKKHREIYKDTLFVK